MSIGERGGDVGGDLRALLTVDGHGLFGAPQAALEVSVAPIGQASRAEQFVGHPKVEDAGQGERPVRPLDHLATLAEDRLESEPGDQLGDGGRVAAPQAAPDGGDHLRPDRVERRDSGDLAGAAQLDEQGGDASGVVLGVAALGVGQLAGGPGPLLGERTDRVEQPISGDAGRPRRHDHRSVDQLGERIEAQLVAHGDQVVESGGPGERREPA